MDHPQSRRVEINPKKKKNDKKRCPGLVDAEKANQATNQYPTRRVSIITKRNETKDVGYW
jgi:hypothetical protein